MAQKDYYLIYELYEGDPIDIHSSIGPAPLYWSTYSPS